jgi:quercetin dioxygenase-like cupin family protein
MDVVCNLLRQISLIAAALTAATSFAVAQADPEKPVTPPDSYRVVMENERVRMIEVHVKPRSKVNVDSPANRERFLYMLSDGALILAPPGKTPYEFALHAGETAVFPAVSPTVENDTDSPVRALMVEVKERMRTAATSSGKGKIRFAKGKSRGKFVAAKTRSKTVQARKPSTSGAKVASRPAAKPPLNLRNANSKPGKKVTGKSKGSSS